MGQLCAKPHPTRAPPGPSRTSYITRANALCSEQASKIPAMPRYPAKRIYTLALASFIDGTRYTALANRFGISACALLQPTPKGVTKAYLPPSDSP